MGDRTLGDVVNVNSVKGRHPSWKKVYVGIHNNLVNKKLKNLPCQVCGYTPHVELAHIHPVAGFPLTATLAAINDPQNILVLCPNHHWEFDHGFLTLDQVTPREM